MTNDAPNPPSAAEPQPKGAPPPPAPPPLKQIDERDREKQSPQVAPEPPVTPVNPDQADG